MCDTFVALAEATTDGSVIFAKNSDREPNEAQCVETIAAGDHPAGSTVKCTYVEIPQAEHTHAILLSRPFWMWGAEMGANEFGVAIGNEAVFTRVPYQKEGGLTGMDLLRLALERSASADEALKTITSLLETYGQGGNCGFAHPFFYHNSFLIADTRQAWILETAGGQWVAVRVKGTGAISNHLTIGGEWDACSDGLVADAAGRGLYRKGKPFNFRQAYSDPLMTVFSAAGSRNLRTLTALNSRGKGFGLTEAMNLLRSHRGDSAGWSPDKAVAGADVCMHAGFGPVRIDQTVGSLVSHLTPGRQTHWVTGTSAPCTGLFKPVWIDAGAPREFTTASGTYDEHSLWWRHETLHRKILKNYLVNMALIKKARDESERRNVEQAVEMQAKSSDERQKFSQVCVDQNLKDVAGWSRLIDERGAPPRSVFYFRAAWNKFNQEAAMEDL